MNRIMVIEDDPAIRRGLATTLRLESFDVLTASRGDEGYRMIDEKQPDLVILDLMIPGMNGYDVCRHMRRHGMATPILMLTAQDQESDRVSGFDAGADDYVTKPFSVKELVGRVRAILRRSEGRSDLATQRELDEAHRIQRRLMPVEIPQAPGIEIAGTCHPARITGGDYFDVLQLEGDAIAVCIGDVCGKGMPAAMLMAGLQAAVKTCAAKGMSPRELCHAVNRLMCDTIGGQGFITFFYGVIDQDHDGVLRCTSCNAGHNPPMLARRDGSLTRLDCGGTVLGVLRDWHYDEQEVRLNAGDRILLYSDGVTENHNEVREEFGEQRLANLLCHSTTLTTSALIDRAIAASEQFGSGYFEDDVTVVAISVLEEGQ
jgi:sigma-B regulation protein RsbU (phosphoserine phosphatase)